MQAKQISFTKEIISFRDYLDAQNDFYEQSLSLLKTKETLNNQIDDFSVFLGTTNIEWNYEYDT